MVILSFVTMSLLFGTLMNDDIFHFIHVHTFPRLLNAYWRHCQSVLKETAVDPLVRYSKTA